MDRSLNSKDRIISLAIILPYGPTNGETLKNIKKKRDAARKAPTGLGLIAFEYDDIVPGVVPGLTMTVASHHQPILARTALLHLGTKSSFGSKIAGASVIERLVEPREMLSTQFADDLKSMIDRLRTGGCQRLSQYLEGVTKRADWDTVGYQELAGSIIEMIDNQPIWEKIAKSNKSKRPRAHGAIERAGAFVRD